MVPRLPADTAHEATGLFLLSWTIFTVLYSFYFVVTLIFLSQLYMMFAAFRVSLALFILFVVLEITFILLTVGALV